MTTWHSSAGIDVRGRWPSVRQKLRPLGERWTAYCACTWAMVNGWRGDLDAAARCLTKCVSSNSLTGPHGCPYCACTSPSGLSQMDGRVRRSDQRVAGHARKAAAGRGQCWTRCLYDQCSGAEDSLLQGRFEEGAQRLLALAEQGRRQRRDAMRMMLVFRSLILALTEIDRLDQAREVVFEAMPLVRWFAWRAAYAPVLALFAARRGRLDTAARLLAAGEARRARVGGRLGLIGRDADHKGARLARGGACR